MNWADQLRLATDEVPRESSYRPQFSVTAILDFGTVRYFIIPMGHACKGLTLLHRTLPESRANSSPTRRRTMPPSSIELASAKLRAI